jgi:hypothetical protein
LDVENAIFIQVSGIVDILKFFFGYLNWEFSEGIG